MQGNEIIQKLQAELRSVKSKVSSLAPGSHGLLVCTAVMLLTGVERTWFDCRELFYTNDHVIHAFLYPSAETEEHGDNTAGETARREGSGRRKAET